MLGSNVGAEMKFITPDSFTTLHILTLAVVIVFLILIGFLVHAGHSYNTQETTITCTTNDSTAHTEDGWKKIETVDYYRIGALIEKGKAQWQCKPGTLVCTAFIEGKAFPETKGCAWYWRKV